MNRDNELKIVPFERLHEDGSDGGISSNGSNETMKEEMENTQISQV